MMPGREMGRFTPRVSLLAEYFDHPAMHQSLPAIGARAGLRWLSDGTGLSLDAGLTFAQPSSFEMDGFARNKVLRWAVPELLMGIWF